MKHLNSRILTLILTLGASFVISSQNFGEITYGHATNISGKQRMLSQRMTKVYLQRLSGKTDKLNKEYQASLIEFNENFATLEKNSVNSSAVVKAAVAQEKKQWEAFLQTFLFNKKLGMDEVINNATSLLKICNNLVLEIEADAKKINGDNNSNQLKVETVNISGKQRMLSQRLTMLYLACGISKGKATVKPCEGAAKIFEELKNTHKKLSVNKLNTPEINEGLLKVKELLDSIENQRASFDSNKISGDVMANFSNKLTKIYNNITGKYAKL